MEMLKNPHLPHPSLLTFVSSPLLLLLLLPCGAAASSGSDYDYGAHPRFICSPVPADADPSCFSTAGPGASSHQSAPPAGWWGASEEAKATILHLRESLVQQRETILDQRETIRELTAKLALCEGFGRGATPHGLDHHGSDHHGSDHHGSDHHGSDHRGSDHHGLNHHGLNHHGLNHHGLDHHGLNHHGLNHHGLDHHGLNHHGLNHHGSDHRGSDHHGSDHRGSDHRGSDHRGSDQLNSHHAEGAGHHLYTDKRHHSNQQGHHGNNNFIPDSPHQHPVGGVHSDRGQDSTNQGRDKHVTPGGVASSPQQMERMLQALKERLETLQQRRNTSSSFSSSLKELLQRKVSALEQQLHHSSPDRHSDHRDPHDGAGHRGEEHPGDHGAGHRTVHDDRGDQSDHHDDSHDGDHHDADGGRYHHDDDDDGDDGHHHDGHRRSNEADGHSYSPHTGFHSNKLEKVLDQLHLSGSSQQTSRSPESFQISFPIRTNYMYGQLKRTLLQEIFAFTLCLWMKTDKDQSIGTPFSYSAPGQANELVLIEWGDNPIELLVDDKAVTLPLSVSDGQWHHVCVTWSTRDGQWEAYQDGVQRGAGNNLSPWRPIKPGGVFILGQEQDILGGRFDATQSFVGEMSDLHMWSHVLSGTDIHSLASCGSYLRGDVIAWSDTEVELHGGVSKLPFDPCH